MGESLWRHKGLKSVECWRWFAFPHPQVIFQFHDAYTGDLRYSETYVLGLD
jgi:hypothetical protein